MPSAEDAPRASPRLGAGPAAGPRRAAAGLLLRTHHADPAGSPAGPTRAWTASSASPSRSRCTPAPGSRWRSHAQAAFARRREHRLAPGRRDRAVARAARARRLCARRTDRAAPRRPALDRRGACQLGRWRWRSPTDGDGTGATAAGRSQEDATARDGLALGLAQAAALMPGVSRNGATLSGRAGARLRARRAHRRSPGMRGCR